jgi:hypothetical protein
MTIDQTRAAILSSHLQFQLYSRNLEQEPVGKVENGKRRLRTLSYMIVPVMTTAILGPERSKGFFPPLPVNGCGFSFLAVVEAVKKILGSQNIRLDDILLNPKDKQSLYFNKQLQDNVMEAMQDQFKDLWTLIETWIQNRYEEELKQFSASPATSRQPAASAGGGALPTPAATPVAAAAAIAAATPSPTPAAAPSPPPAASLSPTPGSGAVATASPLPTAPGTGAGADARINSPETTPVGTSASAAEGGGCTAALTPSAPVSGDRLLLEAFTAVGLDPRRVSVVYRPDSNSTALAQFEAKGKELAAAGQLRGNYKNPAGYGWVLLAMPGQCRGDQYIAAAEYFPPEAHLPDPQQRTDSNEVYLASAEYSGLGVLAQALLGDGLSYYADGPQSSGQIRKDDFWTEPCATQMCRGFFRSHHQLLPICTILISDQNDDQDVLSSRFSTLENHGDSFSEPQKNNTGTIHPGLEFTDLKQLVRSYLKLRAKHAKFKQKRKNEKQAERRARNRGDVEGCHQVTIAGQAVETTGLEGVDLVSFPADAEAAESGATKKKARRVQGEVATEKLIVASTGGKAIRRSKSGKKIGGIEWKDCEVAGAVANWALNALSFKAAGKTSNAGLKKKGIQFWFRAEPRRNYTTRRRTGPKNEMPVIPLVDISTTSMRRAVDAMDLAKNYCFHERLLDADAVALCTDYSTVGDRIVQSTHTRMFKFEEGGTDGAGTLWMIVIATSMVMDVWPAGDKMLEKATYEDEDGVQRELPVEAPRALAAQLIYAGFYWFIMACRCLSLTFDGGGEGTGLGNKVRARETMAGENSYLDLVWLERSAADSAFELLNKTGVFVPLMEFYGYDWENGDFSTRRQDSKDSQRSADSKGQPKDSQPSFARLSSVQDLTGQPDCDDAGPAALPRMTAMRPIFDPLAGSPDPAQPRMSFYNFVVWDMARAFSFLGLEDNAQGITDEMVGRTEVYVECLLDAALELVISEEEFKKVIHLEGFKRLKPGVFMSSEAVFFVMEPMILAMGGRLLMGNGGYTDEPPSPLIQVSSDASKIHVLDSVASENMVENYILGKTTGFFASKRRLSPGFKAVELGPDDTLFVGVHRPGHFVSMVVENLGALDAARMTVADSLSSPNFDCDTHDALRMALRQKKLIREEHEVGHFGLALPRQTLPDCAFYMLVYLATVLSGTFLLPKLWGFLTRLMRCWTFFLVLRELVHRKAIHEDVWLNARTEYDRLMHLPPAAAAAADTVLPDRFTGKAVSIDTPKTAAKDADRMEAAEKAADKARRISANLGAEARSDATRDQASAAWKQMRRARPRQIDTSSAVVACKTPPICARDSPESEDRWRTRYPLSAEPMYGKSWPKTSMLKSPARYFPMVKQDQLNPVPVGQWCGRHRFHIWTKACSVSQDRYPEIAEQCVVCVRNPHIWPRLKAHMQTYIGNQGLHADPIHLAVRKGMRLRVDRCGPPQGKMMMQGESEAPSFLTELTGRTKKSIFTRPRVSAVTRWGTRYEGQWQLGVNGRGFASSVIQATGDGTLAALQTAAAAPFHKDGFKVDGSIRTSAKLGKHLRCLTSQKLGFYHAFGRFLCVMGVRPILSAYSKDLECPASSVCGVGSFFRRFLRLVTEEMFVGLFNSADCKPKASYRNEQAPGRVQPFTGTSHKFDDQTRKKHSADRPHSTVKLAHRGWTSLRGSHKTLFLLNPNANVQKMLGPFATTEMIVAIRALISDLRRLSEMNEELELLLTLENRWKELETGRTTPAADSNWSAVVAAGKDKPVVKNGATPAEKLRTAGAIAGARYVRNMHKAQWAVREIMKDVVRATEKWFDNELYSLFGFLACMIQTRWVDVVEVATGEKMKILIAHEDAIPNGQVSSRIVDELQAQFLDAGERDFLNYYPPQLADLLTDKEAMRQFPEFLRGDEMKGFYLLDADGRVVYEDTRKKDDEGKPTKKPVVPGPAPLWRFPELALRVLKLYFRQLTSNDVERIFSLVARGYRGGGKNVGYKCISSWCRRRDWVTGRFFGMEVNPEFLKVFGSARRLLRENEKRFQMVFSVDVNSNERRKRWRQQKDLPAFIRNGKGKFVATNIVASNQESLLGPKSESGKDPAAKPAIPAANPRRHRIVASLAGIKKNRLQGAKIIRARNGKRNKPESAVQVHQCSKRARLNPAAGEADADADAEPADIHVFGHEVDASSPDDGPASGDRVEADVAAVASISSTGVGADVSANQQPPAAAPTTGGSGEGGGEGGSQNDSDFEADVTLKDRKDANLQRRSKDSMQSSGSGAAVASISTGVGADVSANQQPPAAAPTTGGGGEGGSGPDDAWAADTGGAAGGAALRKKGKRSGPMIPQDRFESHESHPHVLRMQEKMDALEDDEEEQNVWQPSIRVDLKNSRKGEGVFGMQRPDGGGTHVVRSRESPCTFNLAYDHKGDACVKIIKILKTGPGLNMEYYFVYPSKKAIREAAREDDKTIVYEDAHGISKSTTQIGAKTLRQKAEHWKRVAIYHCGDVSHKSGDADGMDLGNIVGTIAWVTKESLDNDAHELSANRRRLLEQSLTALGISSPEARILAQTPIFLGCNFYERKPACTEDVDDDEDHDDAQDKDESTDCLSIHKPTLQEAQAARRALRSKAREESQAKVDGRQGGQKGT